MKYGILSSQINTGLDSELECVFVAPLSIISNQPAYVQDMLNLRRSASSQNVQRWEIESNIEPTNNSANALVHSVMNGYDNVFYVRMPQVYGIALTASGSVRDTAIVGADTISLNGAGCKKGEFIQFTGDNKVYLVVEGGSTIKIHPPLLRQATAGTLLITGGKVTMRARYDSDVRLGITYVDGILSDPGSIKLVEDIE
jgi:hypothetical protein